MNLTKILGKPRAADPLATAFGTDPFALLRRLTPTMEYLFEDMPWDRLLPPEAKLARENGWRPAIDMFEREGNFVLRADLPGVAIDDVKIEVTPETIAVYGERKTDFEEKKNDYYRVERAYGSFYRAIPMPEGGVADSVKANFKDGVLEVTVPLPAAKKEAAPRRVAIEEAPKPGNKKTAA
jgi:HSP20 family protein